MKIRCTKQKTTAQVVTNSGHHQAKIRRREGRQGTKKKTSKRKHRTRHDNETKKDEKRCGEQQKTV